jgi:hypothetical protein
MSSILLTAGDLLTAAINANEWQGVEPFKAVRSYATWDQELKDQDVLHVDVVPVFDPKTELETRGDLKYTLAYDIGVRQRFGADKQDQTNGGILTAAIDPLVSFVEAINDYFSADRFTDTAITWSETEFRAAYVRDQLREMRQFTGIVRLTFEATKSL